MAVNDQPSPMFCPEAGNDMIDQGPLKLSGILYGISTIGAGQVIKEGRGHQMNALRVDGVVDLIPLILVYVAFLLKSSLKIKGGKMAFDAPACQPFTKGGNNIAQSAALPGNETSEGTHSVGQSPRFRRYKKNGRFFMILND